MRLAKARFPSLLIKKVSPGVAPGRCFVILNVRTKEEKNTAHLMQHSTHQIMHIVHFYTEYFVVGTSGSEISCMEVLS